MAYTHTNYKSGKALREDFKTGKKITVFQPGPFGPTVRDGDEVIEGPHYPEPHRFYVGVVVKDGVIVRIKK
jgi:hypothetical protein